jgi:hypothetical protein
MNKQPVMPPVPTAEQWKALQDKAEAERKRLEEEQQKRGQVKL